MSCPNFSSAGGCRRSKLELVTDRKYDELLAGEVELGGVFLSQR